VRHFRIALWDVISGTAEEALEIARTGFLPMYEQQPGFARYEVGSLDNGGIASFTIWDTAEQAHHAVELGDAWAKEHLGDRIALREEHTGDLAWDDPS
jgi:hypothetical protein